MSIRIEALCLSGRWTAIALGPGEGNRWPGVSIRASWGFYDFLTDAVQGDTGPSRETQLRQDDDDWNPHFSLDLIRDRDGRWFLACAVAGQAGYTPHPRVREFRGLAKWGMKPHVAAWEIGPEKVAEWCEVNGHNSPLDLLRPAPASEAQTDAKPIDDRPVPIKKYGPVSLYGDDRSVRLECGWSGRIRKAEHVAVVALMNAGEVGLDKDAFEESNRKAIVRLVNRVSAWKRWIYFPGRRRDGYRISLSPLPCP